jgi:hypothetical protein
MAMKWISCKINHNMFHSFHCLIPNLECGGIWPPDQLSLVLDNKEENDENDEYLNDQEPSVLKLDVMVRNTALQSKTDLYRDVHGFINKVLDVTDKDVESTNGSPLGVIMTSQHVDGMTQCKHSGNLYFIV